MDNYVVYFVILKKDVTHRKNTYMTLVIFCLNRCSENWLIARDAYFAITFPSKLESLALPNAGRSNFTSNFGKTEKENNRSLSADLIITID